MRTLLPRVGWWALLLSVLPGCGPAEPAKTLREPEKTFREFIKASNDLADAFQRVQDADSARAVAGELDALYAEEVRVTKQLPEIIRQYKDTPINRDLATELQQEMSRVGIRLKSEGERIRKLRGLPEEFWRIVDTRSFEVVLAASTVGEGGSPHHDPEFLVHTQELLAQHGHEGIIQVELKNVPSSIEQKAYDKLQRAASGATLYHLRGEKHMVVLGPAPGFKKFVAAIDFGTVIFEDEPQRRVCIEADRRKLGARANSDEEERRLVEEEHEKFAAEVKRGIDETGKRMQEGWAKAEKESKPLDPSDPKYYEQLADRMMSDNHWHQADAIKVLLHAQPSQVASPETRAKIARGFKQLAEDDRSSQHREAVKGLVVWGGKYSVPILLKLLDGTDTWIVDDVIKALGELQDPRAGDALAARLGDFFHGRAAYSAMKNMGPAGEDALIRVAPSPKADICIAAINLLGEVGTEKSLPILRKGVTSRNLEVRMAAKTAIGKIAERQKAEK
jgi:hypothetical protein